MGAFGLEKDATKAIKLWEVKESHFQLGCQYNEGTGVEKDTAKAIRHWEAAALCGHASVKFNLGCKDLIVGDWLYSTG